MKYYRYIREFSLCAHPELVEGLSALILQQVQDERTNGYKNTFGIIAMHVFLFMTLFSPMTIYPFSYDSAIYAAQKGDIKAADEQLRKIVVNTPDAADVLYDAGVLAYQLNNCNEAAAYFARAAECAHDDKNLCFQAHFNAGNACVDNKKLKEALAHYDKALAIEPNNEYAHHNRDRVAQMLQEQEQQKDQQNNDSQQQEQSSDKDQQKNDQENKQEQSNQKDQQKNEDKDPQKENDQQQQQKDNSAQKNGSDQKSQSNQGNNSAQGSKREQGSNGKGKQQGNEEKNHQNSANQKQGNGEQGFDQKSERAQNERDQQQGNQHGKTPEQKDKIHNKNSIASSDKQEQGKSSAVKANKATDNDAQDGEQQDVSAKNVSQIDDPWLLSILNDQELQDKAVNKKLMEARIRQQGGKNGQNCW